ncbi:MAG: hypothetical protein HC896_17385 [Bacteroidales bacterium]|nr:hypothetical protein [Bacteroidales bacterium]
MKSIGFYILLLLTLLLISCSKSDSNSDSASGGKGGSMARFAINGNYLYTVDSRKLKIFDISEATQPTYQGEYHGGEDVETIFPYRNTLFLGTRWGMNIIDVTNPVTPVFKSTYQHVYSCDPVVVSETTAYVTLRSEGSACWRTQNQLDIIDVSNLSDPRIIKTYQMTNPKGLGVDKNLLFVCDQGLKGFTTAPTHITLTWFLIFLPYRPTILSLLTTC